MTRLRTVVMGLEAERQLEAVVEEEGAGALQSVEAKPEASEMAAAPATDTSDEAVSDETDEASTEEGATDDEQSSDEESSDDAEANTADDATTEEATETSSE